MGLLNKIYGLVQAERCLFNIFCDDKFERSEADRRMLHKFNGKVKTVMFIHDIIDHALVTIEKFAAKLG